MAGLATARLRHAERRIAVARARDEVARTLHDGVLQTLAVVQRRTDDAELVALAREQEHELRQFLFSTRPEARRGAGGPDLAARLRAVGAEAERRYGLRSDIVVTDDGAALADPVAEAVAAAVGVALTNAAKHGGAGRATVYAEPAGDGGLLLGQGRRPGLRSRQHRRGGGPDALRPGGPTPAHARQPALRP